jgi:hypothetical protein
LAGVADGDADAVVAAEADDATDAVGRAELVGIGTSEARETDGATELPGVGSAVGVASGSNAQETIATTDVATRKALRADPVALIEVEVSSLS